MSHTPTSRDYIALPGVTTLGITLTHIIKHANHMTMTTSGQIMPWSDFLKDKRKRENKVVRL